MLGKLSGRWVPGSARCVAVIESAEPRWVLQAMKGRAYVDLAGGPLSSRPLGQSLAVALNDLGVDRWDWFLQSELPGVMGSSWG